MIYMYTFYWILVDVKSYLSNNDMILEKCVYSSLDILVITTDTIYTLCGL